MGKIIYRRPGKYYTLTVNYKTGEPTPMELVYYYAEKIKREL